MPLTDEHVEADMLLHYLQAVAEKRARLSADHRLKPGDFLEGQAADALASLLQRAEVAERERGGLERISAAVLQYREAPFRSADWLANEVMAALDDKLATLPVQEPKP
jgi:hypothetical protein